MRPAFFAMFLLLAFPTGATWAQEARPSQAMCDRAKLIGRAYIDCLGAASRTAEQTLTDAIQRARIAIDTRPDLVALQKIRWKNALDEAQNAFIAFRNIECQNVAPYEGQRGIGSFEERLACLVDKAIIRARELDARYGKP